MQQEGLYLRFPARIEREGEDANYNKKAREGKGGLGLAGILRTLAALGVMFAFFFFLLPPLSLQLRSRFCCGRLFLRPMLSDPFGQLGCPANLEAGSAVNALQCSGKQLLASDFSYLGCSILAHPSMQAALPAATTSLWTNGLLFYAVIFCLVRPAGGL
ncbi:hypothetical protein ACLOJK_002702 [Asimina triloba]